MKHMKILVVSLSALVVPDALQSQDSNAAAASPAERLLQAELLEVSKGDLDEATKIYTALLEDPASNERTRARALLYLARCQRKRGQLDEATWLLEKLVATHASQIDVLRQARGYLDELRNGRGANPVFDWFREFQQSEEIQARVFDLGMALIGGEGSDKSRVRDQLLALGTVAVPVLEKLLETSRSDQHRRDLAWVLLRSDRFEHLRTIMEQPPSLRETQFRQFLDWIPKLSEEKRGRFRQQLLSFPERAGADFSMSRAVFLCGLGFLDDARARLAAIERYYRETETDFVRFDYLANFVKALPEFASAVAQRMAEEDCPWLLTFKYREVLEKGAPERLGREQLVRFHERDLAKRLPRVRSWDLDFEKGIGALVELEAWDVIEKLATPRTRASIYPHFASIKSGDYESTAIEWARILRLCGTEKDFEGLYYFAHHRDDAVTELAKWLESGVRFDQWFELPHIAEWMPTKTFAAGLTRLLTSDRHLGRAIALEVLTLVGGEYDSRVVAAAEVILTTQTERSPLSDFALAALLRIFARDPSVGPTLARLYKAEFLERTKINGVPSGYQESAIALAKQIGQWRRDRRVKRNAKGVKSTIRGMKRRMYSVALEWPLLTVSQETLTALHGLTVDLIDEEGGFTFFEWFYRTTQALDWNTVWERVGTIKSPEFRSWLVDRSEFKKRLRSGDKRAFAFARTVASDRDLPDGIRIRAYERAREMGALFDWTTFVHSDDPLLHHFFQPAMREVIPGLDVETRQAIYDAALECPNDRVRALFVSLYDEKDDPFFLKLQALERDPDSNPRSAMLRRLANLRTAHVADRIIQFLDDDDPGILLAALDAVAPMAIPESLEIIGKLTEHSNLDVRAKASETLNSIRKQLEDKNEWQALLGCIQRAAAKQDTKPVSEESQKLEEEKPPEPEPKETEEP